MSERRTVTPARIAEYVHRLSAPRPGTGTAITRPTENTCGNVCASTSWGWDCAYSSHQRPFVITRPIENLLCVGRSLSRLDRGATKAEALPAESIRQMR